MRHWLLGVDQCNSRIYYKITSHIQRRMLVKRGMKQVLVNYQSLRRSSSPPESSWCHGRHSKLGLAAKEMSSFVQTREVHESTQLHHTVLYLLWRQTRINEMYMHLFSLFQKDIKTFPFVRLTALMQTVNLLNEERQLVHRMLLIPLFCIT